MTLETLAPAADVDADAFDDAVLAALGADEYVFKVWGGDWCGDCQRQLPAFGAALDEYEIELIPTVVVESPEGEELARFVEEADVPIAEYLADGLGDVEATA